jgi:hypothetical protein
VRPVPAIECAIPLDCVRSVFKQPSGDWIILVRGVIRFAARGADFYPSQQPLAGQD